MKGLRGVAAGVLTLIVLQALGSGKGPEQGGKLIAWAGTGLQRLMSPDTAGVPRVKPAPASSAPKRSDNEISGGGGSGQLPRNPPVYV